MTPLTALEGVTLLGADQGMSALLKVEGDMEAFVRALASFPVENFETERPSLEELFMNYYRRDSNES